MPEAKHSMEPKWRDRAKEVNDRFLRLAQAKGRLNSPAEIVNFLALAISGEAGELANLIKKQWRGDEVDIAAVGYEMADIRIYLEHLARLLRIDLDRACEEKLEIVAERLAVKERTGTPNSH